MSIELKPASNSSWEVNITSNLSSTILIDSNGVYSSFYKDLVIFILYLITFLVASVGNFIVCYVCFVKRPKSTTFLFIANMSVSDLFSAILIPTQWLFCSTYFLDANERYCGSFKSLQVVSYYISTFTMALISFDRYTILKNPLSRRVRPILSIVIIWMLSLLISSPTLVAMRVSEYFTPSKLVHCRIILRVDLNITGLIRKWRVLMVVVTQYVIPLTIAITFYTLCIKKILSRQRIGECTDQQEIKFYQSKMRTIKMLVLSLSAFAIAWLPVHFVHIVDFYIYPLMPKQCNSQFAYNFFYWLAISSIALNPFIYFYFDSKFRFTARRFFCCCLFLRYSGGNWHFKRRPPSLAASESTRVRCLSEASSSNAPSACS